jgi:hypothetical protein
MSWDPRLTWNRSAAVGVSLLPYETTVWKLTSLDPTVNRGKSSSL